ncbi:MAG: PQQ-binding-like beta-propeller repeat protein [Planctomycetaceae bacterium]
MFVRFSLTIATALAACAGVARLAVPGLRAADAAEAEASTRDSALAAEIVESAGVSQGLCVHLGVSDGRLEAALAVQGKFLIHGLSTDAARVDQVRKELRSNGAYGPISVERAGYDRLPYAEGLVNLIVADDLAALLKEGLSPAEVLRVLAPQGVAYLGQRDARGPAAKAALERALDGAGFRDRRIIEGHGVWAKIVKPRPEGADDWTHLNYGPEGNRLSRDTLAGPPTWLRWIDGVTWPTSEKGPGGVVSAGGRLFYVFSDAPHRKAEPSRPVLYARDAHNGLLLWERPGNKVVSLAMIATPERLYTVLDDGGELLALDAATGKELHRYDEAKNPAWALLVDGKLLTYAGDRAGPSMRCLDAATGKSLWKNTEWQIAPTGSVPNVAVVGDDVYFLDFRKLVLGCLRFSTGELRWRFELDDFTPPPNSRVKLAMSACGEGTLIVGEGGSGEAVHAFSAKDGKHLWSRKYQLVVSGRPQRHKGSSYDEGFFQNGLYWIHVGRPRPPGESGKGALAWQGLDPATGEVVKNYEYDEEDLVTDACHRAQGTERYFIGGHAEFVSAADGAFCDRAAGIHNSCRLGMFPANGLVYSWSQYTGTYLRGLVGMSGTPDSPLGETVAFDHPSRFERGQTAAPQSSAPTSDADWTCYRHDGFRTNRTSAAVAGKLAPKWTAEIGGRLSPPTAAGDAVYVADVDGHRVLALDANSGKVRWSYTAGGRVPVPPTIHGGLCLFGSSDGWVYCLRSDDGNLVWRFRGARHDRRIVVRGQLESAWPVEGGVLIAGGQAWFAAGRHGTVDGGTDLYAADPATGRIHRHEHITDGPVLRLLAGDDKFVCLDPRKVFSVDAAERGSRPRVPDGAFDREVIDPSHVAPAPGNDAKAQTLFSAPFRALVKAGDSAFAIGRSGNVPALSFDSKGKPTLSALMPEESIADQTWQVFEYTAAGPPAQSLALDSMPVHDGLIAARGRLYVAMTDGRIVCLAGDDR